MPDVDPEDRASHARLLDAAIRKASWRLLPFFCILYLINYIDRVNIGFGALTMNRALGLSPVEYGVGAGLFFAGYVAFQVPSNLLLHEVGARRWIGWSMVVWGVVSAAMSLVQGIPSYYSVRFLLGIAEAGFFPGVVYYLVQWFPDASRARIISIFMVGQPASSAIGGPVSTYILAHADGALGLQGWQWLFVLEGLPAILFGLGCFWVMTDRPALARWLHADERTVLQHTVDRERERAEGVRKYGVLDGLANLRVVLLCLVFYLVVTSIYGSVFWVPQIVNTFGVSTVAVGFIVAIPYLAASIISVLWSFHSDRTGERFWHVAIPAFTSGIGFLIAAFWINHPVVIVIGLSAACVGMYSVLPVFWTLPTSFLTGRAVAGAVAFITSFGNLSGIFTPPVVGWIRQTTGGFSVAMYGMACTCLAAGLLTFVCRSVHRARVASVPAV